MYSFSDFQRAAQQGKQWTISQYFWTYVKMSLFHGGIGVICLFFYSLEKHIALLLWGVSLTALAIGMALSAYWIKNFPDRFQQERKKAYTKASSKKLYYWIMGFVLLNMFIIGVIEETTIFKDEFVFWTTLGSIMVPLSIGGVIFNIQKILRLRSTHQIPQ